MSYEGREFVLCEDGHLAIMDSYDVLFDDVEEMICEVCNKQLVWAYPVDDTNGEGEEPELPVLTEEIRCVCSTCGVSHIQEHARYGRLSGGYSLRSDPDSESVADGLVSGSTLDEHTEQVFFKFMDEPDDNGSSLPVRQEKWL